MKKFIALLLSLMMLLTLAACGEKGKTTDGGEDAVSTKLNILCGATTCPMIWSPISRRNTASRST